MSNINSKINLLWTGGWDSTFQLLQLLIIQKSHVSPYYLIDSDRKSLGIEIKTMELIKDLLFEEYPFTKKLLNPIQYYDLEDIIPDPEITEAFHSILKKKHIGLQYERLARLCKELGISDMHLSIERSEFPDRNHWDNNINQFLTKCEINSHTTHIFDPKYKSMNEYIVFKYFVFPIIHLSKSQMLAISIEKGWNEIMNATWFCHNPTCKKQSCGICKPCLLVINEGVGWRISSKRQLISFYYRKVFWPAKSKLKFIFAKLGLFTPK